MTATHRFWVRELSRGLAWYIIGNAPDFPQAALQCVHLHHYPDRSVCVSYAAVLYAGSSSLGSGPSRTKASWPRGSATRPCPRSCKAWFARRYVTCTVCAHVRHCQGLQYRFPTWWHVAFRNIRIPFLDWQRGRSFSSVVEHLTCNEKASSSNLGTSIFLHFLP